MKHLIFNFMLFFRRFFFGTVKIIAAFLFLGGTACLIFDQTVWGKCVGLFGFVSPFLLFLLRRRYDDILFKLCPDDTEVILTLD